MATSVRPLDSDPAPAGATAGNTAIAGTYVEAGDRIADAIPDRYVYTGDGTPLAARFYTPRGPARGAVLIAAAMGVPQSFYAPFASWLADEGFIAATFDYRGTGRSRRGSLRDETADIMTWAQQDTAAVLRALRTRAGGLPITWIGHSLGGQTVPFVSDRRGVAKIITVATGSGYWRQNTAPLKRKVWLFWWLAVPIATPLFGYFPGKRLGMVGDLPRGVVRQWRKWCMQPDYAAGDGPESRALYASVTTPITAISFTDDEMMSAASIDAIHALYAGSPRTMRRFAPGDVGVRRVGHFGFFRPEMRGALWQAALRGELAEHVYGS
jgi:predicted alpha/beta hydrolase